MKSGLEDRNNYLGTAFASACPEGLNEVRPGRPEQSKRLNLLIEAHKEVSMKSGLEDRNNPHKSYQYPYPQQCLNEVRPGRPEQFFGS